MPTHAEMDGVRRELSSWPVVVDGVSRNFDQMLGNIDGVHREIFSGYPDVTAKVRTVKTTSQTEEINITASNISNYFTVSNDAYYFVGSDKVFTSNNYGVKNSTAKTTLTVKVAGKLRFYYGYSTETGYDKFTVIVKGTTVVSGESGESGGSWSGDVSVGDVISFSYSKDRSNDEGGDQCWFYNMHLTRTVKSSYATYEDVPIGRFKPSGVGQYIQSSGTQFMSMAFIATYATRVVVDFEMLDVSTSTAIFGGRNATSGTDARSNTLFSIDTGSLRRDYYGASKSYDCGAAAILNKRITVDCNQNLFIVNGRTVQTLTASSAVCQYPLYLFATNTSAEPSKPSVMRMYSCKIYDNGALIRDLIPYQDGEYIGMYDKVNSILYTSMSTDAFTIA